jgi:hypothetical protein
VTITCAAVVLIFLNTPFQYMVISFCADFHPLFLFTDIVFPLFVYGNVTVARDTPNYVAVLSQMLHQTHTNNLASYKIGQVSHFPIFSHGLSLNPIINSVT